MKFVKVLSELTAEVGNNSYKTFKNDYPQSPKGEADDLKIVNAVFAFIRANKEKYSDLWNELQPFDPETVDIVPNARRDGANITTDNGHKWEAKISTQGKILSLNKV